MNRTIEYRRDMRNRHIAKRKRIIHELNDYWYYKFEGELDKGKIFCSCPLCRAKTNNKGRKRFYEPSRMWKHSDQIKINSDKDQLKEYENSES